ncbi:SDR family NAD(P)-dependent oxidoreductase [Streptomyces sp. NPDC051644]|uniref:SDR family NAD(P)-dependent oxidoreductase n=1 Tax=Streptomyces sp. NPDC051644 TaxID=3365666 RepID=UPI00378A6F55
MAGSLQGETVLVVGRGSGIARAIADAAMAEGAHVVAAGRNREALEAAYKNTTVSVKSVDVTDETSIAALAGQVSSVDHVVSTVSARARGAVGELSPAALRPAG